jgi:four helix bundle protein
VENDREHRTSRDFEEWATEVPREVMNDSLWKMKAYQLALFVCDKGWADVSTLVRDRRTIAMSDQLYRALGSISANIAEGYSRGTGKDRARFYEYALGSARESRDWYFKARHILGPEVADRRLALLSEIIRLLLTIVPNQRGRKIRELGHHYLDRTDDPLGGAGA